MDVVQLAQALIRCPSVTPVEAGALTLLEAVLVPLGFSCQRLAFGDGPQRVENLFAHRPGARTHIAFAGHTDVVPPGDLAAWRFDPFAAHIVDDVLFGRGAVDMKGGIAAFIAAVAQGVHHAQALPAISLLITGDEEGPAVNGTQKMLEWMKERGITPDLCIVGEPTAEQQVGDTLKIGRRGSFSAHVTERGTQGHVAYADRADNPIPRFLAFLDALGRHKLDDGMLHFQPSCLQITSVDVANTAGNVIPAAIQARLNIRFNPHHTSTTLATWLEAQARVYLRNFTCQTHVAGPAFYTNPTPLTARVQAAVEGVTGRPAALSTTGGTSDARFIHAYCPVIEVGLRHGLAHHVDEAVPLSDLQILNQIYHKILAQI